MVWQQHASHPTCPQSRGCSFLEPPANTSLLFIGSGQITWPSLSQYCGVRGEDILMILASVTSYTSGAWRWCQLYAKHIGHGWGKDDSTKAKRGPKTLRMETACWLAQASTKCFQSYGNRGELRLYLPVCKFCTGTLETELETAVLRFQC